MDALEPLGTHQKVLNLNLDPAIFGSFAEIGAGQEVARWFLTAGAASGTVAKTISAYDKEVSDDLYGAGTRYVSRQRLEAMLEREWTQLQGQLRESRGARSRFFAFADTVSARNYAGTNECHGWMGIRFQERPDGEPNEIVLHVNMRDPTSALQAEALGLLGVNLVYAAFHQRQSGEALLRALTEGGLPGPDRDRPRGPGRSRVHGLGPAALVGGAGPARHGRGGHLSRLAVTGCRRPRCCTGVPSSWLPTPSSTSMPSTPRCSARRSRRCARRGRASNENR